MYRKNKRERNFILNVQNIFFQVNILDFYLADKIIYCVITHMFLLLLLLLVVVVVVVFVVVVVVVVAVVVVVVLIVVP